MNILNTITTTKTLKGKSTMTAGNHYEITMTRNGKTITFDYHDNIHNKSNKKDFVFALLSDATAYESTRNAFDFMAEFGYTDPQQAKEVYNACRVQRNKLYKLFTSEEIEELQTIFENY